VKQTLRQWLLEEANPVTVVDRLGVLSGFKLDAAFQDGWLKTIDIGAEISGSWNGTLRTLDKYRNFPPSWRRDRLDPVVASLEWDDGKPTLKGNCDLCGGGKCVHIIELVAKVLCESRTDIANLLEKKEELSARSLSASASEFLASAMSFAQSKNTAAVSDGQKRIFYRLEASPSGLLDGLRIELRARLKSGVLSSTRKPHTWSAMNSIVGLYDSFGRSGGTLSDYATDVDISIVRSVFLTSKLPDVEIVELGLKNLSDAIELACREKHLYIGEADGPTLELGDDRDGWLAWKRDKSGGWQLGIDLAMPTLIIPTAKPLYVDVVAGRLGRIRGDFDQTALRIVCAARSLSDHDVEILKTHAEAVGLLSGFPELPKIEVIKGGMAQPKASAHLYWNFSKPEYRPGVDPEYENSGAAYADLTFEYAGLVARGSSRTELVKTVGTETIVYLRDIEFEDRCIAMLREGAQLVQDDRHIVLIAHGSYSDRFVLAKIKAYHKKVVAALRREGVRVTLGTHWPENKVSLEALDFTSTDLGNNWFGFSVTSTVDGATINMLELLKSALRDKRILASLGAANDSTVWSLRTEDGYRILIPVKRLKKLLPLFLALTEDAKEGVHKLRRFDFGVLEEASNWEIDTIGGSDALLELSRSLAVVKPALPNKTKAALLKPAWQHQEYGVAWCDARRAVGLGGIVGDEYAVGKTLQTLLTVYNAYNEKTAAKQKCSLIVVTKTLFFEGRWQDDAESFLPDMKLLRVYSAEDVEQLAKIQDYYVVVTTYDRIVLDLKAFGDVEWNVLACDEGHKLSNNQSQAHKSIATLKARQKLVITGSPMQNSALDMWSLMNLVVPGLLKEKAWFTRTFPKLKAIRGDMSTVEQNDDVRNENAARLHALGKIVSPFFLRRTNSDVGRELPPIQIINRNVVMEEDQIDLYDAIRVAGKKEVRALIAEKGIQGSKVEVLSQINRLRQACCDPSVVKMNGVKISKASSAKRQALVEICQELVENGKKIVVTSEWNSILENISADLGFNSIRHVCITGNVTGKRRKDAFDAFRTGEASVMLIQLTLAEGVEIPEGDAIIIFEPWWNSKKEEQAIGRLRRDERQKHINVIRLLVPGSVEDAVVRVAESKLADIEAVQRGQTDGLGGLTLSDIDEFFQPLASRR
jgi:hypothetical protein